MLSRPVLSNPQAVAIITVPSHWSSDTTVEYSGMLILDESRII